MSTADAAGAGTFLLGGELVVNRLGFGAMRVTGPGVWGEPDDRAACLATLRRVPELGVNLIDTADSYGPTVSEPMLREALHPYPAGMVIATKGGQVRPGPGKWVPLGRPEYLRQQVQLSLRLLALEQLPLWQLHRIDHRVPLDEQFGVIGAMVDEGLVRHAGLSEASIDEIELAQKHFRVASVQNQYSVLQRRHEDVLDYCEAHGIGFIPWHPLGGGVALDANTALAEIARRRQASPAQIALAWLLQRSPVMLPIPGTSRRTHLEENVAAASLRLTEDEFGAIDRLRERGQRP